MQVMVVSFMLLRELFPETIFWTKSNLNIHTIIRTHFKASIITRQLKQLNPTRHISTFYHGFCKYSSNFLASSIYTRFLQTLDFHKKSTTCTEDNFLQCTIILAVHMCEQKKNCRFTFYLKLLIFFGIFTITF